MLVPNTTSQAYDLTMFDSDKPERPLIQSRVNPKPSMAKNGNIIKTLLAAVIAVTLPLYLLVNKVQVSELTGLVKSAQTQLEQANNENLRLQAELDNLVTLSKVEEYAQSQGMQKISTSQGKHISLDTGGTTDIAEPDSSPAAWIVRRFSVLLEYLGLR